MRKFYPEPLRQYKCDMTLVTMAEGQSQLCTKRRTKAQFIKGFDAQGAIRAITDHGEATLPTERHLNITTLPTVFHTGCFLIAMRAANCVLESGAAEVVEESGLHRRADAARFWDKD